MSSNLQKPDIVECHRCVMVVNYRLRWVTTAPRQNNLHIKEWGQCVRAKAKLHKRLTTRQYMGTIGKAVGNGVCWGRETDSLIRGTDHEDYLVSQAGVFTAKW